MSAERIKQIIDQATADENLDFIYKLNSIYLLLNSIRDTRENHADIQGSSETIAYYNERLDINIAQIEDEEIRQELEAERETVTRQTEEDADSKGEMGLYLGTMMRELGALTRKLHKPTTLDDVQAMLETE